MSGPEPVVIDQHYSPQFYSELWGVSGDTVVRWFQDLPGVLKLSKPARNGRRQRVELRIPYSLAMQVYLRAVEIDMLTLWRRHTKNCPHRKDGRKWTKCRCPVWVDGEISGERIRQSLKTRDWARAGQGRRNSRRSENLGGSERTFLVPWPPFSVSVTANPRRFASTAGCLGYVTRFTEKSAISYVDEFRLELLDASRATRLLFPVDVEQRASAAAAVLRLLPAAEMVRGKPGKGHGDALEPEAGSHGSPTRRKRSRGSWRPVRPSAEALRAGQGARRDPVDAFLRAARFGRCHA